MRKMSILAVLLIIGLVLGACAAPAASADTSKPTIAVSFGYAEGLRYPPSYAIWVQDESGSTETLYATGKAAADSWGGAKRESVLPVWKGVREADVTSGATPSKQAELTMNIPEAFLGKKLTLFIEANASFDYNEYYAEGLSQGDQGYSDVNGQPSVVWVADIDTSVSGSASAAIAGMGDVLGADHELHEAQDLTDAIELLKDIKVTWETK